MHNSNSWLQKSPEKGEIAGKWWVVEESVHRTPAWMLQCKCLYSVRRKVNLFHGFHRHRPCSIFLLLIARITCKRGFQQLRTSTRHVCIHWMWLLLPAKGRGVQKNIHYTLQEDGETKLDGMQAYYKEMPMEDTLQPWKSFKVTRGLGQNV